MFEAWRGVRHVDGMPICSGNVFSIVLTRQRPDRDSAVRRTVCEAIRAHGTGLASWADDGFDVPGIPGVRYYEPVSAFLWGPYDQAVFFLGDEVESVLDVAAGTGAEAQEVIFGPLYEWDGQAGNDTLVTLLAGDHPRPRVIAISCLKLGDHHLSTFGAVLRHAVWRRVHEIAAEARLGCVGLNTWSRAELCVLLLGDDAARMADTVARLEQIQLADVWSQLGDDSIPAGDDLARTIPGFNSSAWSIGIKDEHGRKLEPDAQPREAVLGALKHGHVVVTSHTQFGMLGAAAADASSPVGQVWSQAFSERTSGPFPRRADFCAEVGALLATRSPGDSILHATLRLLPKAGHAAPVHQEARALAGLLRRAGPVEVEVAEGLHGDGLTVDLSLRVSSGVAALRGLAALTLWFRARPGLQVHLLDGSTSLTRPVDMPSGNSAAGDAGDGEEQEASRATHEHIERMPEPAPSRPLRGFDLLRANQGLPHNQHTRRRLNRLGLGHAEQHALTGLIEAVKEARSRPDMFGAMLWLDGAANYIQSTVFDPHCGEASLPEAVHAWIHHVHHAYQQCLQFSAANRGSPPIRAELPYGVNQLVGTIAGATAASLSVAPLMGHERSRAPALDPVVLFWPDSSVALRRVRGVGFFRLSAPQAMTPLVLTPLLLHEPGHWMLQMHIGERKYGAWEEDTRSAAREILPWVRSGLQALRLDGGGDLPMTEADPRFDALLIERLSLFLEDVFCNAVWRRLGCEGDASLFRAQVLAAQALGVRTGEWDRKPHERQRVMEAWAATLAHIRVQDALAENGEDLFEAFRACGTTCPQDLLDEAVRFGGAEMDRALEAEEADAALRVRVDALWLGPLCSALTEPSPAFRRCILRLRGFLRRLERDVVRHLEARVREHDLRATLDDVVERVRHGRPVPTPPWEVVKRPYVGGTLQRDAGYPAPVAFLWVRAILRGVTLAFQDLARTSGALSLRLDGDYAPERPSRSGPFTDPRGGLAVAGREERSLHQKVRAAAIEALADLSSRLRAGKLFRLLRYRRNFKRWRAPSPYPDARWREVDAQGGAIGTEWLPGRLVDLSPAGMRLHIPAEHAKGLGAPGDESGAPVTHWVEVSARTAYRCLAVRRKADVRHPEGSSAAPPPEVCLGLELARPGDVVDPHPSMVAGENA